MSDYKIIEKEDISQVEVLTELEKLSKEKEELTYREEKTIEYLKQNVHNTLDNFNKAKVEIIELEIPRLEKSQIIKIIELNPKNGTELRAILSSSGTVLVDDNVQKILEVLKKYN